MKTPLSRATLLLSIFMSAICHSEERDLGPQYKIQGEYAGTLEFDDSKWGAQVIALGDGKYESVGFPGGLPGDGWDGEDALRLEGETHDGAAIFEADEFSLKITGGKMHVVSPEGDVVGTLDKVHRKSETMGAKPPANATVLFDGSSVDQWENGKLTADKLLAATGTETKTKYGDHRLHLEFRTPFLPELRGQARGNSGVYVQSRYEVQVLDSFGLEAKDNECGGIYSINKPKMNMCYPPETWQTYDIDFHAAKYDEQGEKTEKARITVKHNGVVIHDDQELAHGTPGRHDEAPGPDALFLQDHGNPVVFRNIWVVAE